MLDRQSMLSINQALTTTAFSTDTYDLSVARDLNPGGELEVFIMVTAALTGGTSVSFELITSANANLSSPTVYLATPAIAAASLVQGYEPMRVTFPAASFISSRYIGIRYTIAGTFSAGTVTAGLVLDRQANRAYASGLNVSGF